MEVAPHICNEFVYISAKPPVVWEAVKDQRKHYKTIIIPIDGEPDNTFHLIQTFGTPLGDSTMKMRVTELPYEKVHFKVVQSSTVKAMEGYWHFQKTKTGTQLFLVIYDVKPAIPIPRKILQAVLRASVRARLQVIKKAAEEAEIAIEDLDFAGFDFRCERAKMQMSRMSRDLDGDAI